MTMMGQGKLGLPLFEIHQQYLRQPSYGAEISATYHRAVRDTEIGRAILARLERDPRVQSLKGKMLNTGSGASRFESSTILAGWWLWRANIVGEQQANQDLESFLVSDDVEVDVALWVYGAEPTESLRLTNDITFFSASEMPDSSEKEEFLRTNIRFSFADGPAPIAALVKRCSVKKIMPNVSLDGPELGFDGALKSVNEAMNRLHLVSTLLNCLPNVCCMPGYSTSYLSAAAPLGPFGGSGGGSPIFDVLPRRTFRLGPGHEDAITKLVDCYNRLHHMQKVRLQRALHRLAQAKGRVGYSDKVLDLGIALEMLLLNPEHHGQELPGQLTLHFRLRGAWLIASTLNERKELYRSFGKIYSLRSQLAHNGFSNELDRMNPSDRELMLTQHISLAERVIQRLILRGEPNDWSAIVLGNDQ